MRGEEEIFSRAVHTLIRCLLHGRAASAPVCWRARASTAPRDSCKTGNTRVASEIPNAAKNKSAQTQLAAA